MISIYAAAVPAAVTKINLAGSWTSFWAAIKNGWPDIAFAMAFIGVGLVVFALAKWAWDRRRGGSMGQGAQPLWGALIPGAIMMAPDVLLPLGLKMLDWIANIGLSLIAAATKQSVT